MKIENLAYFKNWFDIYSKGFFSEQSLNNQNITLKRDHTQRVCRNICQVAKSISLSHEEIYLAETAALFHDIARFEQFKTYQTFDDRQSFNHAEVGVLILKKLQVLKTLDQKEQGVLFTAIKNHNKIKLGQIKNKKARLISKLLRDADKLDILSVLISHYEKQYHNSALDLNLEDCPEFSETIIKDLFNRQVVHIQDVKSINDYKLLQMSWIFDINFTYTLNEISRNRFIERMVNTFPKHLQKTDIFPFMMDYRAIKLPVRGI